MRAILGQQVTVKAARTLATRFVDAFGEPVVTPFDELTRAFPLPSRVAQSTRDDIGRLGIVGARAEAMIAIARLVCGTGDLDANATTLTATSAHASALVHQRARDREQTRGRHALAPNADPATTIAALVAIKGIGLWTAHYVAMRALAWPDAWPPQDVALLNAMNLPNTAKGQREADAIAEAWRPWRSYAVLHTWRKLEKST